jgi:hypothetical protein
MRRLLFIAFLAISASSSAQGWVKSQSSDAYLKNVYVYVSKGDTIAKKWNDTSNNDTVITSERRDYIELWHTAKRNMISLTFENDVVEIEKGSNYNVSIEMEDSSVISGVGMVSDAKENINLFISLKTEAVAYLKAFKIKQITIHGATEDFVFDSQENELDTDFIKKCANLVWPEV